MTYSGQSGPPGQRQPYWQGTYPPQQAPYGQQWYGPPPRRPKTGLWVGLTVAAVAVVAFAVTAFAWPGFLLGDDKDDKSASGGGGGTGGQTASCERPGGEDPQAYGQAIADCINAKNKAVLQSLTCSGNSEAQRLIDNLDRVGGVTLTRAFTVSDDEARAEIKAEQGNEGFQAVLKKSGESWCWKRMDAAGAG